MFNVLECASLSTTFSSFHMELDVPPIKCIYAFRNTIYGNNAYHNRKKMYVIFSIAQSKRPRGWAKINAGS